VFFTIGMNGKETDTVSPDHVAVVDVNGTISSDSSNGASADKIIKGLERAFEQENSVAVVLDINSPGGSPVQSAQVYREINRLKDKYPEKTVYAVGADIMASGAYYIASAADFIYADPTSLVGSVGVIMGGFGFSDAMNKLGVERRVYTAGEQKSFMDPFSEADEESIAHVNTLLSDIHREFISAVKNGRGDQINGTDEELFNGLVWTGNQAISLGLIDGAGSVREVALQEIGIDKLVNYSEKPNPFQRIADRISANFAASLVEAAGGTFKIQ
jgi:protease-4